MIYTRVGVAIIKDGQILFMHRVKKERAYYCLPGGRPEAGETPQETAMREIKEETSLDVILGPVLCEADERHGGRGLYFVCAQFTGTAELGGPEKEIHNPENQFILEWIAFSKLEHIIIYPEVVTTALLRFKETLS